MLKQRLMWIVWPAFIVAGVTEMVVFAMVDPEDIHWFGNPLELSRQWIYTGAFFIFWVLHIVSGALTTLLSTSPFEANRCPLPASDRPHGCPKQLKTEGTCSDKNECCSASNSQGCCHEQNLNHDPSKT